MFKYLRNLNGSNPPTEAITFSVYQPEDDENIIRPGMIVSVIAGEIDTIFIYTAPLYLVVSTSDNGRKANCVKLHTGMVFEADIADSVSESNIYLGSCYGIHTDDLARGTHLGPSGEENVFQVIDKTNVNKKKATVVVM